MGCSSSVDVKKQDDISIKAGGLSYNKTDFKGFKNQKSGKPSRRGTQKEAVAEMGAIQFDTRQGWRPHPSSPRPLIQPL